MRVLGTACFAAYRDNQREARSMAYAVAMRYQFAAQLSGGVCAAMEPEAMTILLCREPVLEETALRILRNAYTRIFDNESYPFVVQPFNTQCDRLLHAIRIA